MRGKIGKASPEEKSFHADVVNRLSVLEATPPTRATIPVAEGSSLPEGAPPKPKITVTKQDGRDDGKPSQWYYQIDGGDVNDTYATKAEAIIAAKDFLANSIYVNGKLVYKPKERAAERKASETPKKIKTAPTSIQALIDTFSPVANKRVPDALQYTKGTILEHPPTGEKVVYAGRNADGTHTVKTVDGKETAIINDDELGLFMPSTIPGDRAGVGSAPGKKTAPPLNLGLPKNPLAPAPVKSKEISLDDPFIRAQVEGIERVNRGEGERAGTRKDPPTAPPGTVTFDGENAPMQKARLNLSQNFRSMLSIHKPGTGTTGAERFSDETITKGFAEEFGGEAGRQFSKEARSAQLDFNETRSDWYREIDEITTLLRQARGVKSTAIGKLTDKFNEAGQKAEVARGLRKETDRDIFDREFVELIEKEFTDPTRKSSNPAVQKALEKHDALVKRFENYIRKTQEDLGRKMDRMEVFDNKTGEWKTVENVRDINEYNTVSADYVAKNPGAKTRFKEWGITDRGYFRHTFLGNLALRQYDATAGEWHTVSRHQTYAEALAEAKKILDKDPTANIDVTGHITSYSNPDTVVSDARFWQTVNNMAKSASDAASNSYYGPGSVRLTAQDMLEDLKGLAPASSRRKPLGVLLRREGMQGYSTAYEEVMQGNAYQVARAQELSKLNRKAVPLMAKIRSGKDPNADPSVADEIQDYIDNLWGTPTPTRMEEKVGNMLLSIPGWAFGGGRKIAERNNAYEPVQLVRKVARRMVEFQSFAKLAFNPASAAANLTQPMMTLFPYTTNAEFLSAYKLSVDKKFNEHMRKMGVLNSSSQIESGTLASRPTASNPFEWASQRNRAVGYAFGYQQGEKAKMTDLQKHILGLAWAELVEFDNSAWNAAPIARSTFTRVAFQFKGFEQKNTERMFKAGGAFNLVDKRSTKQKLREGSRLAAALFTTGGINAAGPVATLTGSLVFYYAYQQAKEAGASEEWAERIATGVQMGLPAVIGADVSRNVAVLQEPYGNTIEEKTFNYLLGPTGTFAKNLTNIVRRLAVGEPPTVATLGGLSPYFRMGDAALQMAMNGGETKVKIGKDQTVKLNPVESTVRLAGFTPSKVSRAYAKREAKTTRTKIKEGLRNAGKVMKPLTEMLK